MSLSDVFWNMQVDEIKSIRRHETEQAKRHAAMFGGAFNGYRYRLDPKTGDVIVIGVDQVTQEKVFADARARPLNAHGGGTGDRLARYNRFDNACVCDS